MRTKSEPELLHTAAAYCSLAERCIQDVRKKISTAGASADAEKRIIERLVNENFINESRFCKSFVNDKLKFNQWGRIKISYELKHKNIAGNLIEEALNNIDEDEYEQILTNLLKQKKRSIRTSSESDTFIKLCRYAAGKGFEKSLIIRCVKPLCKGDCDEFME